MSGTEAVGPDKLEHLAPSVASSSPAKRIAALGSLQEVLQEDGETRDLARLISITSDDVQTHSPHATTNRPFTSSSQPTTFTMIANRGSPSEKSLKTLTYIRLIRPSSLINMLPNAIREGLLLQVRWCSSSGDSSCSASSKVMMPWPAGSCDC